MKILITGIAGFIGSHTAERLKGLGHTIIGVDKLASYYDLGIKTTTAEELQRQGIQVTEAYLTNNETYDKLATDFNYIFHFAAHSRNFLSLAKS